MISTGDFQEALAAIIGLEWTGLSATTITRLKSVWEQAYNGVLSRRKYECMCSSTAFAATSDWKNIRYAFWC